MKTIKFWDIPSKIKTLDFDGDKTDLRLHNNENFRWGAKGIREYKRAEKQIDKFEIKGNGWLLYAGYDVSGFSYWMKQMEETNYISISVMFDSTEINIDEIEKLENALQSALYWAEQMSETYNFNPDPYFS